MSSFHSVGNRLLMRNSCIQTSLISRCHVFLIIVKFHCYYKQQLEKVPLKQKCIFGIAWKGMYNINIGNVDKTAFMSMLNQYGV